MQHQSGLTLVELLVTLAILVILVGVAFPGFQGILARNDLATGANSFLLAVNYARSAAVREGGGVTMTADDPSAAGDEWGPGWTVTGSDGATLRVFDGLRGDLTLDSPSGTGSLTFTGRGALVGGTPRTFDLCIPATAGTRITVTAIGRTTTTDLAAGDC